jgi:hypothetical protein
MILFITTAVKTSNPTNFFYFKHLAYVTDSRDNEMKGPKGICPKFIG